MFMNPANPAKLASRPRPTRTTQIFQLFRRRASTRMRFSRSNGRVAHKGHAANQNVAAYNLQHTSFCHRRCVIRSKWVHKSFFSQNIFRGSKKIFCDFSVRKEVEKRKLKRALTFAYNILLTKRKAKVAGYWFRSFFAFLWTSVHKNAERELVQPPWPRACIRIKLSPDAN